MRVLFLFLVMANLAFFAWMTLVAPEEEGTDPRPLRAQIEPARIKVLPATAPAGPPSPASPVAPKPKSDPPQATATAAPGACVEWGSFTLADAPSAEKALEPLGLGARLVQRRVEEIASWWVYMPPQGNRANAQKKATELKGLGIDEWFIVADDGAWRWAISLGVFRSEEAARNRLDVLRAKGVRTAQLGERELQVPKIWLQARNADAGQLSRWREIARSLPGAEFRDCAP